MKGKKQKQVCNIVCTLISLSLLMHPMYIVAMEGGNDVSENTFRYTDIVVDSDYTNIVEEEVMQIEQDYIPISSQQISLLDGSYIHTTKESAVAYLREQMVKRNSSIDVCMTYEMYSNISYLDLLYDAREWSETCSGQEGDALEGITTNLSVSKSGDVNSVTITYDMTYVTTFEQEEKLTEAVNVAMAELNLFGESEYTKVYKIYNYICDNVNFDSENRENDDYKLKDTAYAALCNKTADSLGYAMLFYRMCKEAGLSVKIIKGSSVLGDWCWNIVRIGDYYYYVDSAIDGFSEKTFNDKFLKNQVDFEDMRYSNYRSDEFVENFPISILSWGDERQVGSGVGAENLVYNFTTIDEITVSSTAKGKKKLLIFYADWCPNSIATIESIRDIGLENVDIIAINANKADKETVCEFKSMYGDNSIVFTYDASMEDEHIMSAYASMVDITSLGYPLLVYIDSTDVIQRIECGRTTSDKIEYNFMLYSEQILLEVHTQNMNIHDTCKMSVVVQGEQINNAQLKWSTSNAKVATVDTNGLVTAVGGGTCTITGKLNDKYSVSVSVTVIGALETPQVNLKSTATGVQLSWNEIANAEGYIIFRKEGTGSYVGLKTVTGGSTTSYTDTTAKEGSTYVYAVRAYRGTMQSSFVSKNITHLTSLSTPQVTLKAGNDGVILTWNKITNAAGYRIFRKEGNGSYIGLKTITNGTTVSYADTAVTEGKTYTYAVRAYNGDVQSSFVSKSIAYIKSLATPQVSLASGNTGVTISWGKIANAEGYRIFRKEGTGSYVGLTTITNGATTSYVDTTVKEGKTYTYAVRAYSGEVQSSFISKSIEYTKNLATPQVSLTNGSTGVTISWGKIANAEGYKIFRKEGTGAYVGLTTVTGGATTSYVDTTVKEGKMYTYAVRAYKGTTMSSFVSKSITYTKELAVPQVNLSNSDTGVIISWGKIANAEGYKIFRKEGTGAYVGLTTVTGGAITSYVDTTVTEGKTYTYAVRAYSGSTMSSFVSKSINYVKGLAVPQVNLLNSNAGVILSWNQVTNAEGYKIFRKEGDGAYVAVATVSGGATVNYVDTNVTEGTTYVYAVRAYKGTTMSSFVSKKIVYSK